jgi:acetoin utilization deacetylase AcuC-like enzyme
LPQVRHEISHDDDAGRTSEQMHLINLESTNHFSCDALTSLGFGGSHLRINAPREAKRKPLTEAHSKERVKQLQSAKTAGQIFHATGGTHINSDDFFRS